MPEFLTMMRYGNKRLIMPAWLPPVVAKQIRENSVLIPRMQLRVLRQAVFL